MTSHENITHTIVGTFIALIAGWATKILHTLGEWSMDVIHTALLAVVGASVSFLTALAWKAWQKRREKKRGNRPFKKAA